MICLHKEVKRFPVSRGDGDFGCQKHAGGRSPQDFFIDSPVLAPNIRPVKHPNCLKHNP